MAGDVLTTATAGADETARIGEPAETAQDNGQDRENEPDRVTAAGPRPGTPRNLQLPDPPQEPEPVVREIQAPREGQAQQETKEREQRPARPSRQTRSGLAPAAIGMKTSRISVS